MGEPGRRVGGSRGHLPSLPLGGLSTIQPRLITYRSGIGGTATTILPPADAAACLPRERTLTAERPTHNGRVHPERSGWPFVRG